MGGGKTLLGYTANQNELKLQHSNGWQNIELSADNSPSYVMAWQQYEAKAMAISMHAHTQLKL